MARRTKNKKQLPLDAGQPAERKWVKVVAPHPWKPKAAGEQLVGIYIGKVTKTGPYGDYSAVMLRVDTSLVTVSGALINDLAGAIPVNRMVRVVYLGHQPWASDPERYYPVYELYIEGGE